VQDLARVLLADAHLRKDGKEGGGQPLKTGLAAAGGPEAASRSVGAQRDLVLKACIPEMRDGSRRD
jgi:hypothetical protein